MNTFSTTGLLLDEQRVSQLSSMLKAMGQPLRIQLVTIIIQKQLVSIPTLQEYLPGVDQFVIYSNLRFMHKKQLVKKMRKGREVFYGMSEKAMAAGFEAFLGNQRSLVQPWVEEESVLRR